MSNNNQINNSNNQVIAPLNQPLTGEKALFKQLELLGRNGRVSPYTIIKKDNNKIYAAKLVEKSGFNGKTKRTLEVSKLINPKTDKGEPTFHSEPNERCKIFRFNKKYHEGYKFLEETAKKGGEMFIIPNYIDLAPDGDNGIGAGFITNLTCFFLEIDDVALPSQWELINWFSQITGLVPSAIVFSGGKSLHVYFKISGNFTDIERWQRIQRKLILIFKSDYNIQNPNREMRLAGVVRASKKSQQSLEYYSDARYTPSEFENKLDALGYFPMGLSYDRWRCARADWFKKEDKRSQCEKEESLKEILAKPEEELYPAPSVTTNSTVNYSGSGSIPIPLEECLSKANRDNLPGISTGSRNKTGFDLACDLIGCEKELIASSIPYSGDPYQLFIAYCQGCALTDWRPQEWETIWRSALNSNPDPAVNYYHRDGLTKRVHWWRWHNDLDYKAASIAEWKEKNGYSTTTNNQPKTRNNSTNGSSNSSQINAPVAPQQQELLGNGSSNNGAKTSPGNGANTSSNGVLSSNNSNNNGASNEENSSQPAPPSLSSKASKKRNKWQKIPVSHQGELGFWFEKKQSVINPETGQPEIVKITEFDPRTNFDFEIVRELKSSSGGGIVINVKRSFDRGAHAAILSSEKTYEVNHFTACASKAIGGLVVCNLSRYELNSLIAEKLSKYHAAGGKKYKIAERIGVQPDGHWVFDDCQFDKNGNPVNLSTSSYVFDSSIGRSDGIPRPRIIQPNPNALPNLLAAMKEFHGSAQIDAAVFVLGWSCACVHYQSIMKAEGYFPILNMYGDPGNGKTTMSENGLALAGWRGDDGSFSRISESALYEHLDKISSLPIVYDDPEKKVDLDELIKRAYNGKPRKVRERTQTPRSSLCLTTNHVIGENNPTVASRMVYMPVERRNNGNSSAWSKLMSAREQASAGFGDIIKIGYNPEAVAALAKTLGKYLKKAHPRATCSIAIFTWYALKIAELSGYDANKVWKYVISTICGAANDSCSAQNSLTNFLINLSALRAKTEIGEWDCRVVENSPIGKALAVCMPSVMKAMERYFTLNYSKSIVEGIIKQVGGVIHSVQRFWRCSDEAKAYHRAKFNLAFAADSDFQISDLPKPPEITRRCVLIPWEIVREFIDWVNDSGEEPDAGGFAPYPGGNPPGGDSGGYGDSPDEPLSPPNSDVTGRFAEPNRVLEVPHEGEFEEVTVVTSKIHFNVTPETPERLSNTPLSNSSCYINKIDLAQKENENITTPKCKDNSDIDLIPNSENKSVFNEGENQLGAVVDNLISKKDVTREKISSESMAPSESQPVTKSSIDSVTSVNDQCENVTNNSLDSQNRPHEDSCLPNSPRIGSLVRAEIGGKLGVVESIDRHNNILVVKLDDAQIVKWLMHRCQTVALNALEITWDEIIAAIDFELKRLKWNIEASIDYVLKKFGNCSRHLLSDDQLFELWDDLKGFSAS